MPSKAKIFEHWMNWLHKNCFDWAEPSCWSCRKYWGDKYDIKNPRASRKEIIRNWNRVPLQRCHIIPRQFGGSDEVENLFLMCAECHDKAPNTKSREAFLQWTSKQNHSKNFYELVMKEIRNYELQDKIKLINDLIKTKKLWNLIEDDLGIHVNQSRGGIEITVSTVIAAIAEYIRNEEENL
ncbi:HNH endonuclease [Bacillus sp. B190/17]|uniref:HNH endonuclease n=1 Tax=Bacillus lumedeiriae TaxID=3058829 RepID=A0ABW8ICC6_9BACI